MRAEKKPLGGIRESRNPRISFPSKSVVFRCPSQTRKKLEFPRHLASRVVSPNHRPHRPAAPGCVLLSLSRRAVLISPSTIATPTDLTSRTHTTIVQPGTRQISLYTKCRPLFSLVVTRIRDSAETGTEGHIKTRRRTIRLLAIFGASLNSTWYSFYAASGVPIAADERGGSTRTCPLQ